MERILRDLARRLNAFDEASLMSMWEDYARRVQNFEPTRRWEEAALVFGFIQALRWKNQLFNYHWASESRPRDVNPLLQAQAKDDEERFRTAGEHLGPVKRVGGRDPARNKTKVLRFRPREEDRPPDQEQDPQE